jgi:hypothetical protein
MNERQFEPGEPGSCDPAWDHRGGTPEKAERRQAGTPATLEETIRNDLNADVLVQQKHRICKPIASGGSNSGTPYPATTLP